MPSMKKGSFPKPSMEMIDLLAQHVAGFDAEERKMFGCPCYFVHGNMFAGVFADGIFSRFSEQDRDRMDEEGLGTYFEPVGGRRMKEYRTFTKKALESPGELDAWLARSYSYVSTLGPKKKG